MIRLIKTSIGMGIVCFIILWIIKGLGIGQIAVLKYSKMVLWSVLVSLAPLAFILAIDVILLLSVLVKSHLWRFSHK